ncbi:MAG: glycosyltransferase, partial [Gammaproteobacteria bacterium]
AFPDTFPEYAEAIVTGNPVRAQITPLPFHTRQGGGRQQQLRLLILGGSQGAAAINQLVPQLISGWCGPVPLQVWHQCGERHLPDCTDQYASQGVTLDSDHRLEAFIDDMAEAYHWADIVLCRSGASTVFELAAAGLPSILIPYPYHSDRQQERNARWLANDGAAKLVLQDKLNFETIDKLLVQYATERSALVEMGERALAKATPDAADTIARHCLEVVHGH